MRTWIGEPFAFWRLSTDLFKDLEGKDSIEFRDEVQRLLIHGKCRCSDEYRISELNLFKLRFPKPSSLRKLSQSPTINTMEMSYMVLLTASLRLTPLFPSLCSRNRSQSWPTCYISKVGIPCCTLCAVWSTTSNFCLSCVTLLSWRTVAYGFALL